ncbi:MAG: histidinol dehydrogenase [Bacilli bacterium]
MIKIVEIDKVDINTLLSNNDQFNYQDINDTVTSIIKQVQLQGDQALIEYTKQFDGVLLDDIRVDQDLIDNAFSQIDSKLQAALKLAYDNIYRFHLKQKSYGYVDNDLDDIVMGQIVNPINAVGLYIPNGSASYPSTLLMNVIPALIAGCTRIVVVSPPNEQGMISPAILAAAHLCGITEIYKVGGAQAIAALTYGTKTIKPVNKIFGPGNIYVAMAKRLVYGHVAIDMIAGPSEILIIADENANPHYIAADLLSQAEHDQMASSIFVTTSKTLALQVQQALQEQLAQLKRIEIAKISINNKGLIIIVNSLEQAFNVSNEIAPEHLELMIDNAFTYLSKIKNAGSIFIGPYAPEPLGDYLAGPNHTLPTSGTAAFSSALSVDDFIKKSSFISYTAKALNKVSDHIINFAQAEGLDAHANAIKIRKDDYHEL